MGGRLVDNMVFIASINCIQTLILLPMNLAHIPSESQFWGPEIKKHEVMKATIKIQRSGVHTAQLPAHAARR